MDANVGIVGVGTMGSMALWQLARRGVSVMGFEQFGIGHDQSAAGGETRIFRTAYKEGAAYIPILQEAYKQWRELESETGNQLLTLTKGLTIGEPGLKSMKNVMKSIEEYDLEHEILHYEEAKKHYPQHRLLPNEMIIVDHNAGFLRPQYAIVSAVYRAKELGAIVHNHTHVEKIQSETDGVSIVANGQKYKVGKLLITTGPWINQHINDFDKQIEVRRLINTWFFARDLKQFDESQFPPFTREGNNFSYYGIPAVDSYMVKIGLAASSEDRIKSPNDLDRNIKMGDLSSVKEIVGRDLPNLFEDPGRVSVYMEAYTKDKNSVVGWLPGHDNIAVLSGFSGHGFKMAPAIGKIGADLVLDENIPFSIGRLSPDRFADTQTSW
ncbi:N-methyl-L-tryptophan oxidase [Lentibacillus salicampi]|uniref:N-methyl-L-tryptophan oxidase n=1 Tax=Lentibacillus salicampi TaxID=175306 RepID=A0A4Y9A8K0_9BACI|nr:N-methyl-L-tryptophan oxidase [Lentibacillus salicampi]TFJ92113.1 N-methyl-L-tryptophan oxidase [Lentibacillus salicampi]